MLIKKKIVVLLKRSRNFYVKWRENFSSNVELNVERRASNWTTNVEQNVKMFMPKLTCGWKRRAMAVLWIRKFFRNFLGGGVGGGKPGFKNCVPQLTRPDCIRYQKLWNMHLTILEIIRKSKPARRPWRREKITDTERKKAPAPLAPAKKDIIRIKQLEN